MTAAEKSYEYQRRKYEKEHPRERQHEVYTEPKRKTMHQAGRAERQKAEAVLNPGEKAQLLMLTIAVGILCIGLIICTAYAAKVKYNNNKLMNQNQVISGEIEALSVKIHSGSNLQMIEDRAANELGMIHPTADQFIYMSVESQPSKEFAVALKEKAYN